jgi:predicted aconitase with swiveling domain
MALTIKGRAIIAGEASGALLVSPEPLSFWGGYDYHTGEIIDRRHALSGQIAAGRVLVLPFTRGSSTTTQVLLEAIRAGTAPAAIVSTEADTFLALAAIVAQEMYGRVLPILVVSEMDCARLETGRMVRIEGGILSDKTT